MKLNNSGTSFDIMIISHKYKFIYIKNRRVGGTSMEIALSKFCGPDDIITPTSSAKELRRTELGYTPPQNFNKPKRPNKKKFMEHMSAEQIKRCVPISVWQGYFKFCIERNPWDKLISKYYHSDGQAAEPEELCKRLYVFANSLSNYWISNWGNYSINGWIAVDHVLLYETLYQELPELQKRLGLPEPIPLNSIWEPGNRRKYRGDYRLAIDDKTRDYIERKCCNEIEAFGYKF